jgi:hypothetical protein
MNIFTACQPTDQSVGTCVLYRRRIVAATAIRAADVFAAVVPPLGEG